MHGFGEGALVEHRAVELVELGAGLGLDIAGARGRPAARAPAGGFRPVRRSRTIIATASSSGASSRSRASASGLLVIAVVEHRGQIGGDALHPPRRRSPRPAPARPRRTARARPGSAARGGDGSRRCGRRAAAPSNRRGRAGSPPRAGWACAAARAAAPSRPPARSTSAGLSAAKATSRSGRRAIARVQEASARLNGSLAASGLRAGLAVGGFDVDGRHGVSGGVRRAI